MNLEEIKYHIMALSDADHALLAAWIGGDEAARRRDEKTASVAKADVVADLQDAGTLPKPDAAELPADEAGNAGVLPELESIPEWQNPGADWAKMYHQGAVVRHNGRVWVNNHPALNSWEPGGPGVHAHDNWEDVTWRWETTSSESGVPVVPDFRQPTGAHDAYGKGEQVAYNGAVYESLIDANSYSPDDYPAGWQKVS